MGKEIVYCSRWQSRLTGADFESGTAVRLSNYVYCTTCLSPAEKELLENSRKPSKPPPTARKIAALKAVTSSSGALPTLPRGAADPKPTWRKPLVLAGAGIALALIVLTLVVVFRGGNEKKGPPEAAPAPVPPTLVRPSEPPKPWDPVPELVALRAELLPPLEQKNFKVAQVILERARI